MKKGRTFFPLWIICFNREMEQKCLKRVREKKNILDLSYDLLFKHIPFNSSHGSGLSK